MGTGIKNALSVNAISVFSARNSYRSSDTNVNFSSRYSMIHLYRNALLLMAIVIVTLKMCQFPSRQFGCSVLEFLVNVLQVLNRSRSPECATSF
jgi:hypothetical protein